MERCWRGGPKMATRALSIWRDVGGTALGAGRYRCVNTIVKILFTVIFITHGLRSAALAQAQSSEQPGAKACANDTTASSSQNLSDKLD